MKTRFQRPTREMVGESPANLSQPDNLANNPVSIWIVTGAALAAQSFII